MSTVVRLEKLDFRTMTGVTLLTVADNVVNSGLNKLWLAKNKILMLVFFLQSLYDILLNNVGSNKLTPMMFLNFERSKFSPIGWCFPLSFCLFCLP